MGIRSGGVSRQERTPKQAVEGMKPRYVLLLAAALFLWWLGGHDLWSPDEPYYAEGAREMIVDGKWVVPHVNGVFTPDKPPLFFWLIAFFSLLFGEVTPWTARLPSALAALGTVALTMRLTRRLCGPRTAWVAGFVLATTYMFWDKARWSQTDSVLCLLIWVALSAFEAFRSGDVAGNRAGLLFWGAAALAVLDKGPPGIVLPLGIALVILATDGDLDRWWRFAPATGPVLFAAVLGVWAVSVQKWGPDGYSIWSAFQEHFLDRGLRGLHHKQPPWYFLKTLPLNLLPWTGLIPGALVLAWRRRRLAEARLPLVAAVFVVAIFSISPEKRELYALPAIPALAILVACLIAALVGWNESGADEEPFLDRRWLTVGQSFMGVLAIAAAGYYTVVARQGLEGIPFSHMWPLFAVAGLTGVATLALVWRGRLLWAALTPAIGSALICSIAAVAVYPALDQKKSARRFSQTIREATAESRAEGLPVLATGLGNLPEHFAFYSDGVYTTEANDLARLMRHLERPEAAFAVARREAVETIAASMTGDIFVVASTHLARRDVLLITNIERPGSLPYR